MKFVIRRTGERDESIKPCEEATQEGLTPQPEGKPGTRFWVVEINTLKELIDFRKKCGNELIIWESNCKEIPFGLEIYDSYRE